MLRLVRRGHLHRRAEFLEPGLGFGFGERPAQRGFFFFELRFQVGAQFGDDVVLPLPGQVLSYGFEITVEKLHGVFLTVLLETGVDG
jgi:hypothetical protein